MEGVTLPVVTAAMFTDLATNISTNVTTFLPVGITIMSIFVAVRAIPRLVRLFAR